VFGHELLGRSIHFLPRNGLMGLPSSFPSVFAASVRRAWSRQKHGCSGSGGFAWPNSNRGTEELIRVRAC